MQCLESSVFGSFTSEKTNALFIQDRTKCIINQENLLYNDILRHFANRFISNFYQYLNCLVTSNCDLLLRETTEIAWMLAGISFFNHLYCPIYRVLFLIVMVHRFDLIDRRSWQRHLSADIYMKTTLTIYDDFF